MDPTLIEFLKVGGPTLFLAVAALWMMWKMNQAVVGKMAEALIQLRSVVAELTKTVEALRQQLQNGSIRRR